MQYKYILFDLDGTVTDPKIGITKSVAYALEYFDIKVNDLDSLCKFIGPPLKNSFMEYYGFDSKKADLAISKYREYFSVKGLYENKVYNGMEELLKKFKDEDKKLIIATSKPTVFAIKILEHFNIIKYFDFIAGSELSGDRTKKSEVIKYAIEQNNIIDMSKTIMIGDRKHDIIGAKEVGIDSVGVLYGYGGRDELSEAGADYLVEAVNDLNFLPL